MSKILVIADVHINDYKQRNPNNNSYFRLYQGSRTVAQNIIKVGKSEGCDYIVMAGDIVEKYMIRPYIQAEVKLFLDTIMSNFKEGWIIYGNHDLDGKSMDQNIGDACLGVMLPSNLHYAHQTMAQIDKLTCGFCNWMPEFDLSWIPGKVDILFTHATICYAKDETEGRLFESQKLDESKFDLAICGDIHKRGQIGKYVSIGSTQRCKLGDPEESSGIVVDCSNGSWGWVNLNPDDNLMKFKTTTDLDQEGWHEDEFTWYVYKQESTFLDSNGQIKVDAWEEISTLVDDAISKSGLTTIHQEVLKNISNIDAGEVDFNFTLLHLHCENWRSIKNVDVDFSDHDRILVLGSNGSGKSSFLSAIKFALCDVSDSAGISSLKSFVTFGEKNCFTEVTFLYQGNTCKIRRGTNTYGLWINGEQLKYNEKRMFEKDARERFPFIKYMDSFFFNADQISFLKSLSPERVTEITSKFLKLNRVETYNDTAKLIYEQVKTQASDWNTKIKETEKLLGYINDKLSSIVLPDKDLQTLEAAKTRGLELQRKNNLWNQYMTSSARLMASIQNSTDKLKELKEKESGLRQDYIIDQDIQNAQTRINELNTQLVGLGNIRLSLEYKTREYENLRTEGNNAWIEAKNIGLGKVCSHCGQVIKTTEAMEKHKNELLQKVEEVKQKIGTVQREIQELTEQKNNSDSEYNRISSEISELTKTVSTLMAEKSEAGRIKKEIINYTNSLDSAQTELGRLGKVDKVELPDKFMEKMSEIESGIVSWNLYTTTTNDKTLRENELSGYQSQVGSLNQAMTWLEAYIKLTGPTGIIFEQIFEKLCKEFSSNTVKYIVERKGKGNREHLSLVPYFNKSGNWISIQTCSSGERTYLDIDYLSKIVDRIGLMIFDEFFKNLDSDRLETIIDVIKNMNVGCLLLTSHAESIPAFNNKSCLMGLDENGMTKITFR